MIFLGLASRSRTCMEHSIIMSQSVEARLGQSNQCGATFLLKPECQMSDATEIHVMSKL